MIGDGTGAAGPARMASFRRHALMAAPLSTANGDPSIIRIAFFLNEPSSQQDDADQDADPPSTGGFTVSELSIQLARDRRRRTHFAARPGYARLE